MKLFFKKILGVSILCMSSYALALTDQEQCEQNGINYKAAQILIMKLQQAIAAENKNEVVKL
ncbi:MAG: hypothetical protein HYX60_09700, partial [Legionella longbeachae]|nr:hypothetical protein [Legionella longbeachae]